MFKNIGYKKIILSTLMLAVFLLKFTNFVFADNAHIIAINYKYDFIVVDKGRSDGLEDGKVFYVFKNAFQVGRIQVRSAKSDLAACDIIGLAEGAVLKLGERILLVEQLEEGLENVKHKWRDIPLPEGSKIEGFEATEEKLADTVKKIESEVIQKKQFEALRAKAKEIEKEVAEEKKELAVSFSFKNADIHDVLRVISKQKGLNIITPSDMTGKVTVSFKDVSVYRALSAMLNSVGYTYIREDNIIRVFPMSEGEADTRHLIFRPTYAKVSDLDAIVSNMLTDKGKILLDEVLNRMMVIDYPSNLERIKNLLKELDEAPKQVMIEAKILDIRIDNEESLGIDWLLESSKGYGEDIPDPRMKMEFPTGAGLSFFKYATIGTNELDILIEALRSEKRVNILSEPTITTLNNKEASIEVVGNLAYKEWEEEEDDETGNVTRTFTWAEKEIGLTLTVTPHIISERTIMLEVVPRTEELQEWLEDPETGYSKGYPVITTRELSTEVMVSAGNTLVLGGLVKKTVTDEYTGVPMLSHLPIIGGLFRKKSNLLESSELMIFITPHIVELDL